MYNVWCRECACESESKHFLVCFVIVCVFECMCVCMSECVCCAACVVGFV